MKSKRKIGQFPWRYKESMIVAAGFVFVGFMLQWLCGAFDFTLLQWPVNILLGGITGIFLVLSATQRKNPFYQWFSGVPMAVTLIGTLVILGIIMGLTPQVISSEDAVHDLFFRLGFRKMTSAWPFVLIYIVLLLSLGSLITRRLIDFRIKDYAFYLNHIGLWLLLFAAGAGASDIKRYVMYIREGEVEWRVYNSQKEVLELPVAIELNDFYMEEYPPKLAVIDRKTGAAQPEEKPHYFQIDEKQLQGRIGEWDIVLKEYIHQAVRSNDSTYREVHMPGASPAAKIEISNQKGIQKQGWVCAGNMSQLYMVLNIDEQYCVAMMRPEPKRFVSDVHIYSENGQSEQALLEVNKPYKIDHWMLYQYGYDNEAGNMSTYSAIELVYDPWVIPVYTGILLLACGSVCMIWSGNKRKEDNNDME